MITLGVQELDGSSDNRRRFYGNKSEKSMSLPKKLDGIESHILMMKLLDICL